MNQSTFGVGLPVAAHSKAAFSSTPARTGCVSAVHSGGAVEKTENLWKTLHAFMPSADLFKFTFS